MNTEYNHYNELTEEDETFEVEFSYIPAQVGKFYGEPADCYEDSPAEIDIVKVLNQYGVDITSTLSKDLIESVTDKCLEEVEESINDWDL